MHGEKLPPFGAIQEALRKTTEHLALELHAPTAQAPDWTEFEWTIARAVAAMQGISVLLAKQLRWRGPARWREFLEEQRGLSIARDARISALLASLDSRLREFGVCCVGLKGAALRSQGIYQPGERPTSDVDLLARAEDLPRIEECLRTLDYVPAFAVDRHHVFESHGQEPAVAYGEHPANPLKIEVHTRIGEALPSRLVDITAGLRNDCPEPGLNPYRDTGALMQHLLMHAAGNMRTHALRQVQLHDIALLARKLNPDHWSSLLGHWWVLPPLALTERYYEGSVPAEALAVARERCHRLLRFSTARSTLFDVSWSNLRISAFPGITWSRSPLEALSFVRSRVMPSRHAFDELRICMKALPHLEQVPWYGRRHTSRIVRWLFTSPPRVQTMVSVRAAFESSDTEP
ncbi:MAG TPA: nucleotidyltransferase family protein [Steroidobacteraceae bacterium]|nr:nucleotidyltransferase family protein [Steroidobacteraceae bacterium]